MTLIAYLRDYPFGEFSGEVEFYLSGFYRRAGEPEKALFHTIKQLYLYPESDFTFTSRRRGIDLLVDNRTRWKKDIQNIEKALKLESIGNSMEDRYINFIQIWSEFENPVFIKLGISEAKIFLSMFPHSDKSDAVIMSMGILADRIGDYKLALKSFLKIVDLFQKSTVRPEALIRIARIYANKLFDFQNAILFYNQLINAFTFKDYNSNAGKLRARALLEEGWIFEKKLREIDKAESNYRTLINDYPKTKEAKSAAIRLHRLQELGN